MYANAVNLRTRHCRPHIVMFCRMSHAALRARPTALHLMSPFHYNSIYRTPPLWHIHKHNFTNGLHFSVAMLIFDNTSFKFEQIWMTFLDFADSWTSLLHVSLSNLHVTCKYCHFIGSYQGWWTYVNFLNNFIVCLTVRLRNL